MSLVERVRWSVGSLCLVVLLVIVVLLLNPPSAQAARIEVSCTNKMIDSKVIQHAINASKAGDEIVIKGSCQIASTIKLLDNRTYRGDSRGGTLLKQADGANLAAMIASESWVDNTKFVSSNVRIERLTLDGNKATNIGTVPLMLRTWNSRIYDVEIRNAPSDGIRATSLSQNGTHLSNTMVNTVVSDVFVTDSGNAGFRVLDPDNQVTDWVLERSWIAYSGTTAVELDNSAGWQLRNLHLYGIQQHAINAKRCFGTGITDNYIEGFGLQGTGGTYFGIRCTVQGDATSTITGNKIHMLGALPVAGSFIYLGLDGVNYGTGYLSVVANAVLGKGTTRETGLSYQSSTESDLKVVSVGNLVENVGVPRYEGPGVTVTAGQ